MPLQADILKEAKENWRLYNKKLVDPAPKNIKIIPYVSGYFMKGSEFDVKLPLCFLCGKVHYFKDYFLLFYLGFMNTVVNFHTRSLIFKVKVLN